MLRPLLVFAAFALSAHAAPPAAASLTCASCHRSQTASQHDTGMAHALETGENGQILKSHPKLTFHQGPYSYAIEREGNRSAYRVTDGKDEVKIPISWAFGLGAAGQTYVLQRNGTWYESRVSYYRELDNLDLTVGARPGVPRNLEEAVGRELSVKGALECFNCHSTNSVTAGALHTDNLTPGVQCARCHDNTAEHLAGFVQASAPKVIPKRLGSLSAEDTSEFCGQCHRTWSTIALQGPHNVGNVRFQPYRLTNSKCFDTTDARIRCTACHDPHVEVVQKASFYDAKCKACHSEGAKPAVHLCKVATANCTTCHMPKIAIAEAHNKFTDHWIRVVRPNQPYPN